MWENFPLVPCLLHTRTSDPHSKQVVFVKEGERRAFVGNNSLLFLAAPGSHRNDVELMT